MGAIEALGNQREDYCQLGTKRENKLPPLVVMRAAVAITGLLGATPPPHSPRVPPTQPSTPQVQPSSPKTQGDDDLGIFGQSHPPLPWIRNRGDLGEISVRPINGSPGGRYLVVVLARMTTLVDDIGFMMG